MKTVTHLRRIPRTGSFIAVLSLQILLLLFSEATLTHAGKTLSYKRVHVVDRSSDNRNWLFRGNMPMGKNKTYEYDTLIKYLHQRALNATNTPLPEDFDFTIITFLNVFNEGFSLEKSFFDQNPSKGKFYVWPILGAVIPPQYMDESVRVSLVNQPGLLFGIDKIPSRIEQVHKWIHEPSEKPQVIYWHCLGGCDRTGVVSAAYNIKYKGFSLDDAHQRNVHDCGRHENYWSTSMLGWYCLYYEKETGKDIGHCLHIN